MLSIAFKQSCERIAVDWRRKLGGWAAYDPLPSFELLKALGVVVLTPANMPGLSLEQRQHLESTDDWSGAIIALNPITVLRNPALAPARHESTMMHECAHVILKHPMIPFDPMASYVPRNDTYETEAVYLGAACKFPGAAFYGRSRKG